ncbi:hypothetical protein CGBL_0129730 [Corynebacterium glutamicum]|nr:hypothetical protein CGBL_0129730 [Corynebacterium glutamicum]
MYKVKLMKLKWLAPILPVLALAGCGNYLNVEIQGIAGLSRDAGGDISVHMYVCGDNAVDELILSGGFGDGPSGTANPALGTLKTSDPESGYVVVNIADPAPWEVVEPINLPTEQGKYIIANPRLVDKGWPIPFAEKKYMQDASTYVGTLERLDSGLVMRDMYTESTHVFGTAEDFVEAGQQWCEDYF